MEARLFLEGTVPECATPEWYAGRDRAAHVDEALHRPRLLLAAEFVKEAADMVPDHGHWFNTVSDFGAGDGGLLQLLSATDLKCWGYDLQPSNIEGAKQRHVDVRLANVLTDDCVIGEIVVCTEMLEHLVDPHGFVKRLFDCGWPWAVVASSPWTETAAEHYENHLWVWDVEGYQELFEGAGWKVERQQCTGMFQVVLAVRP